jgi:hypothetical protein
MHQVVNRPGGDEALRAAACIIISHPAAPVASICRSSSASEDSVRLPGRHAWNLVTSLKSYIDPRVYYRWGQQVEYDVLGKYYPTTLRRKHAWVKREDAEEES